MMNEQHLRTALREIRLIANYNGDYAASCSEVVRLVDQALDQPPAAPTDVSEPAEASVCQHEDATEFKLHWDCDYCNKIRRKDGREDLNGNPIWESLGPPCKTCDTFEFYHVDLGHEYEAFVAATAADGSDGDV